MKTPLGILLAFVCGCWKLFAAEPAVTTVLFEDQRVRVYEVRFAPGAEARTIDRPLRVVRALVGGTLERTLPNGKVEKESWTAGQVRVAQADRVGIKNVGSSELHLYIVQVKN